MATAEAGGLGAEPTGLRQVKRLAYECAFQLDDEPPHVRRRTEAM
ncbi:hypothetical protein [Streptomyces turgidiscabies]|uniref:Uncharacterized protein n=1 Tax=Streptomyces turgidiscabies TaxID=85558 RepID=A0ABU0RPQ7_9ACTN|nr:hypothetical protein [Streptomyces turgidiscabies]MDQ0933968.1 hypothetical protein [Streptomyces turgidiscabies]